MTARRPRSTRAFSPRERSDIVWTREATLVPWSLFAAPQPRSGLRRGCIDLPEGIRERTHSCSVYTFAEVIGVRYQDCGGSGWMLCQVVKSMDPSVGSLRMREHLLSFKRVAFALLGTYLLGR